MLIKCPECGSDISDSAMKCPHCGKQLKKPKRGFFGKIFLWLFYLFNILMLLWVITGMNAASDVVTKATTEAEKAGATIGTGIGMTFIMLIWAIGDIITGLLALMTRPKVG